MADNYIQPCKTQLLLTGTAVRNVINIRRTETKTVNKFGTSTTSCEKVAVGGSVDRNVSFGVVLSQEEFIDDLMSLGDEVTLAIKYYISDGTLIKTRTMPVIIQEFSDDIDIDNGTNVVVTVNATSTGAWSVA